MFFLVVVVAVVVDDVSGDVDVIVVISFNSWALSIDDLHR